MYELRQDNDSTMSIRLSENPGNEPGSVIAECPAQNRRTISNDKSSLCEPSFPTIKSLRTLAVDSTTSVKGLNPYWEDSLIEKNSILWLPTVTALRDLDLSLLTILSNSTVENSWFSTLLYEAPNRNSPKIFSPSCTSFLVGCTADEFIKSRKIRLYPTTEQRQIFRRWLGVSRLVYNRTVEYLKAPGTKASFLEIKKQLLDSLPEFCKEVPFQIKSIAIFDACIAVQNAKKKFKQTGEFQEVSFRSRKDPEQSLFIPASAIKPDGIYPRISGKGLRYAESLPGVPRDSRLILRHGKWYLAVAFKSITTLAENQGGRVVALDPGIRSFITFFAEDSCGHLGKGDFGQIQCLCFYLDDLISRRTKEKDRKRRQRMKKAEGRLRDRIRYLIDELHHKAARFRVDHFDVMLLPTFESQGMALKTGRKIRKKSVRSLLTFAHYRFKQFLKHKAFETGKCVLDVCEAYTSKTISWTGEIIVNLGGRKMIRANGIEIDRDLNGARGIFLRALVDTPAIIHSLGNGCIC